MKPKCERCARHLRTCGPAFICSFECTWCTECAAGFEFRCPNCGGELVGRPRREHELPPSEVPADHA